MITPLRNRIIVRPLEDKQSGSIQIPDEYKQRQTAEIVSVGPDLTVPLEIGQTVLLHPNAAWANIEWNGEQLRVIDIGQLLAIMSSEAEPA